ncbi:MAG: ABC transporter ATP-binding protein/permease [Candidatus Cloacimonetes bacterium]|nr:ABC transporter ATP-binding protein/permease [Candidatus Cloacimonadota bacterium]
MKKEMSLKEGLSKLLTMIMTEKGLFFGGFLFMSLTTVGRLMDPIIVAHIIDHSVPNHDLRNMFFWGGTFTIVILLSGYMSYLQFIWMAKLGIKLITGLKSNIFNHLLLLPIAWFDKTPVGTLISRVESDCERVRDVFSNFSVTIIGNILFFIGMLIVLLSKNWQITLMLLIPMIFVFILAIFMIKYLSKFYKKSRELNADITGRLTEYIQGINTVQVFNQQQKAEDYINEKSKEKQKLDTKASFIEFGTWGVNDFLISYILIIVIILFLSPKIISEQVSIGVLIIFLQYAVRLVWPIVQITENLNQFQRAFVSLKRVFGLLDEVTESRMALEHPEQTKLHEPELLFSDLIEFKNVWFKYKEDEWVLKNVSFCIKKGSKVAFVGASGGGKTTTIALLCRFYNIQKGAILVDGVSIYDYPLEKWRKKIGLILQDIILFPGNLLENVRIYNDDITIDKVQKAIDISHADALLKRVNNNLESEIKERGQNLSMGERQLVSFARAICFDPEIIIMDEATASIDAKTETLIQQSMKEMLAGKTAVIIAHRLISVIDSDKIFFFENGEIIASGKHHELMEKSKEYRKLVELQFLKKDETCESIAEDKFRGDDEEK